jgi:hypothetical protein
MNTHAISQSVSVNVRRLLEARVALALGCAIATAAFAAQPTPSSANQRAAHARVVAAGGPRPTHASPKCPPGFTIAQTDERDFNCTGEVSCPYGWTQIPQRDPNGGGTGLFGNSLPVGIRGSTMTLVCQLPAPTVVR